MKRVSLVASLLAAVAAAGCAPTYDVFTTWTIDGNSPAVACEQLVDPQVQLIVHQRDVEDGPIVSEQLVAARCVDGQTTLKTAAFADVFVLLLDGDIAFGTAGPFSASPGRGDAYAGSTPEAPLAADIEIERGRLRAELTVVGQSCSEAGASEFSVSLRRNTGPLASEIIVENVTVSCTEEGAVFEHAPVEAGSLYEVIATTTIDGVTYATSDDGTGEGVVIPGALTELGVDLDAVGRP